jgi:hypothetical protein
MIQPEIPVELRDYIAEVERMIQDTCGIASIEFKGTNSTSTAIRMAENERFRYLR